MNKYGFKTSQNFIGIVFVVFTAFVFSIFVFYASNSIMWTIIMISLLLGVCSIWFSMIIPIVFVIATIIVPNEILPYLSGTNELYGFGPVRLHPAGITLFVGSFCYILIRRNMLFRCMKSSKTLFAIFILFSLFIISILFQTFYFRGFKGIPQCLENYIFPLYFFLFLLTLNRRDLFTITKYYIFSILLIACYGICEYFCRTNVLYDYLYINSNASWYFDILSYGYRITTTIGHPLKNATYFLFAVPLCLYLFRKPFNFISAALLCCAIFATGSRVASIVCIASIIACYSYLSFDISKYLRTIVISIIILGTSYILLFYSPIGRTLITRFFEASDSTSVRIDSLINFRNVALDNFFGGKGMGVSFEESAHLFGRGVGFENPWIMLTADVGFLTMMLYLSVILIPIFSKMSYFDSKGIPKSLFVSFISILIMVSSYNSFGARSTLNFLPWFNIALLYKQLSKDVPV